MKRWLSLGLVLVGVWGCKQDSGGEKPSALPVETAKPAVTSGAPAATTTAAAVAPAAPAAAGKLMGSCMIMGVACSDYYGAVSSDTVKKICQSVGKWSDGACPTAGIQGTCTKSEPGGIVNKTHTYPPGTPATAKKACDNTPGGVFSGG